MWGDRPAEGNIIAAFSVSSLESTGDQVVPEPLLWVLCFGQWVEEVTEPQGLSLGR